LTKPYATTGFAIGLDTMNLKFNGKITEINEGVTVENFIRGLDLPKMFAVELNGEIIYKEQYPFVILKEHDEMEIVTFTGGG